jgi:hypothetical protein
VATLIAVTMHCYCVASMIASVSIHNYAVYRQNGGVRVVSETRLAETILVVEREKERRR